MNRFFMLVEKHGLGKAMEMYDYEQKKKQLETQVIDLSIMTCLFLLAGLLVSQFFLLPAMLCIQIGMHTANKWRRYK